MNLLENFIKYKADSKSLKKETLKAISELKLFDTEPQWLTSALTRHGPTPTLSTSDVRILKSLMENKKH